MASVSQVIPNYVQGMSQQPDQLKVPGQLKDLVNAYPDVTRGCMKRLGSKKIADLGSAPDGTWFGIDRGRDPANQYIGNISSGFYTGQVQIWNMLGEEMNVMYSPEPYDDPEREGRPGLLSRYPTNYTYLVPDRNTLYDPTSDRNQYEKYKKLKVFQGDGKVFILNDQVVPKLTADDVNDDEMWHEAFVSLRQVQYQRDYLLAFDDPLKNDADENISWEYAKGISDVKFVEGDPNKRDPFPEDKIGMVCDLSMGYQTADITATETDTGGKIQLVSSSNPDGEDLRISLEVVCVTQQVREGSGEKTNYLWQADYTPRLQLIKGGKNWKDGDLIVIRYQADQFINSEWRKWGSSDGWVEMSFRIGGNGTQTVQADIGYISVKTDIATGDEQIPFASANDIITGFCFALEAAGVFPLKYDEEIGRASCRERV